MEDPLAKPEKNEHELEVLTCRQARHRLKSWAIDEMEMWDKRRTEEVNPMDKGMCNDRFWKIKEMNDPPELYVALGLVSFWLRDATPLYWVASKLLLFTVAELWNRLG